MQEAPVVTVVGKYMLAKHSHIAMLIASSVEEILGYSEFS
jgi:hypothetical protein